MANNINLISKGVVVVESVKCSVTPEMAGEVTRLVLFVADNGIPETAINKLCDLIDEVAQTAFELGREYEIIRKVNV